MNIGIVCYPTYGGSGVVATELGKALAHRGHQIHFITYAQPMRLDRFQDNLFYHEVELPNYPLFEFQLYSLSLASKIADVARFENLDIVHAHYAIPHAVSAYLARQILGSETKMKTVTTLHGTDITLNGLDPSFLPLVRFSIEQSDAVTAVSRYLAEATKNGFNVQRNIHVINNFIDTDLYQRQPCTPFKRQIAPENEKILMHISNFRPVKRVADTIHIFAKVRDKVPSKLVLIGDGPDRIECERLSRELGINEHVRFLGKQTALPELLSSADLFLLPSQSESFGLSALEAMSCGVPVVATSMGGIPEVISHGETGYIAELGDIDRMAKYAVELLTNSKKWQLFSANAREKAISKFKTDMIVPQYEQLYESLL
ncbi:MAG: N-acetyl-alpha-D-glucosaminyl L-malate synthase BshA [Candidatus Kapaibacterium sp.]|jgi:N-acetyl-alpha-D-glucosaminyl L-malate synthase BshA